MRISDIADVHEVARISEPSEPRHNCDIEAIKAELKAKYELTRMKAAAVHKASRERRRRLKELKVTQNFNIHPMALNISKES